MTARRASSPPIAPVVWEGRYLPGRVSLFPGGDLENFFVARAMMEIVDEKDRSTRIRCQHLPLEKDPYGFVTGDPFNNGCGQKMMLG